MCGIVGSINSILLESQLDLIKHRGPDASALVETELGPNKIFLGHTRLSILDLSEAGNQPMFTDCGNYGIVFNGEIYNHKELRKKINGIEFNGQSDTETILYYLRKFGINAVKEFNGIFAFAFLDKIKQKLYLVRDHLGVKPLYYYIDGKKLIFGSEIKVIKYSRDYNNEIDTNSLHSLLTLRYNPAPQTLFKGIRKLEAATYLEYDISGTVKQFHYWASEQKIDASITENDAVAEYKRLLEQSVDRQLLSDVPV